MKPRVRISVEGYDTSLPEDDINKTLVNLFNSCGRIINVTIPTDPETRLVERRAFIILGGDDAEEKALQLNGSDVGGWNVLVQVTPEEDEETMRYAHRVGEELMFDQRLFGVYVSGFDTSLPDDDVKSTLINHFSSCGDITIVLMANKDRCAKIYFSQQDAEGKALKFNASEVGGWKLAVRPVATVVNSPRYWSGPFATVVNSPRSRPGALATVVNSVDPKFGHCIPDITIVLMAKVSRNVYIYFTHQEAEAKALKFNGSEVGGWKLTVHLAATVVNNPPNPTGPLQMGPIYPDHMVLLREEIHKKIMAFKKSRGLA